jgi:hypothetical protein
MNASQRAKLRGYIRADAICGRQQRLAVRAREKTC